MLEKVKAFFRRSWTILVARFYVLVGLLVGIVPMASGLDWSPFIRRVLYMVPEDLMPIAVGAVIGLTGLLFEYLRTITTASLADKREAGVVNEQLADNPNAEAKIVSGIVIVDPKDGTPLAGGVPEAKAPGAG